jgi:arginine exporter protein ArgO
MSLIAATQITAIATVVLALGAIITAWFAIKAFRKQTQEVALLQQQAERDIDQRRRAQASQGEHSGPLVTVM